MSKLQEIETSVHPFPRFGKEEDKILTNINENWSVIIRSGDTVARNYLHHLIDRIEVDENEITVIPKEEFILI